MADTIAYIVCSGVKKYIAINPDDDLGSYNYIFTDNYLHADKHIHPSEQAYIKKQFPDIVFEQIVPVL